MNAPLPRALSPLSAILSPQRVATAFLAIRLEGGLFPAEFLQQIARQNALCQSDADYGVPQGRSVRDEIGRHWMTARAMWREFQ